MLTCVPTGRLKILYSYAKSTAKMRENAIARSTDSYLRPIPTLEALPVGVELGLFVAVRLFEPVVAIVAVVTGELFGLLAAPVVAVVAVVTGELFGLLAAPLVAVIAVVTVVAGELFGLLAALLVAVVTIVAVVAGELFGLLAAPVVAETVVVTVSVLAWTVVAGDPENVV